MQKLTEGCKALVIGCPPPFESNNNVVVTLLCRYDIDVYEYHPDKKDYFYTNSEPIWECDTPLIFTVEGIPNIGTIVAERFLVPLDYTSAELKEAVQEI